MAKQVVGLGTVANDGTGDTLRAGGDKINDNFNEVYTALGDGTTLDFSGAVAATPSVTANTAKVTNATHTGDVTGATALTIANDAVSNAKLADMATTTIKGRVTAGAGDPEDLTAAQAKTVLAYTAADIPIADAGSLITATDAEGALQEGFSAIDGLDSRLATVEGAYLTADTVSVSFFNAGGNASAARPEIDANVILWGNSPTKPTNMGTYDIWLGAPTQFVVAVSDETTALTTGTGKRTFRMPGAFTVTGVRASVNTAPTGSVLTVDINEGGTTILSTKLTIDATEKTSTTAATAAVISDSALADDAEISIDIDTVGSSVAGAGLKVTFLGYWV